MINNLDLYNAWKRSTLDRLSGKYRAAFVRVFNLHALRHENLMLEAIENDHYSFHFHTEDIKQQLAHVLDRHQHETVHVAVSDGMREVHPDTKLSSWEQYPYWYPVEKTFVELGEKKRRDRISDGIFKKLSRKTKSFIHNIVTIETRRYELNLRSIFKHVADQYYGTETGEDAKDVLKVVIKRLFEKTENQAEMIFRTETTRYFNDARLQYFSHHTDVDFVQLVAVTDGRISNICESRDGYVIPIGQAGKPEYKPPFHPNCRTVQSPLDTDLSGDKKEVDRNLGSEFGHIHSETSNHDFVGRRSPPVVKIPPGWLRRTHF